MVQINYCIISRHLFGASGYGQVYRISFALSSRISLGGCVRPLVGPSVRRSVGPSVCDAFVKNAWNVDFYVQKLSRRYRKPWITFKQLSSISSTKGGCCRTQISSSYPLHLNKRIHPKMHEDASLAAGPCFRYHRWHTDGDGDDDVDVDVDGSFRSFFLNSLLPFVSDLNREGSRLLLILSESHASEIFSWRRAAIVCAQFFLSKHYFNAE